MSATIQPRVGASSSTSQAADVRVPVVGPLTLGIRVVNDQSEARTLSECSPSQHLEVAVGVAERHDRSPPDDLVDAHGLAGLVVDEIDRRPAGRARVRRRAARISTFARLPTTCSGGMPYTRSVHGRMNSTPPPDTMKVLKPLARRYVSTSSIGWKTISCTLCRCRARRDPAVTISANSSVVFPACVAATNSIRPFSPLAATAFVSCSRTPLKGCVVFHSGCVGASSFDAIQRERELEVERLLGPERAVVVEGRDAFRRRNEVCAAVLRHLRDKVEDRLFRRSVVPRWQSVSQDCAAAVRGVTSGRTAATPATSRKCRRPIVIDSAPAQAFAGHDTDLSTSWRGDGR